MRHVPAFALALTSLVASCGAYETAKTVDHDGTAPVVEADPACTAAHCDSGPRGAYTVGDFRITDATFAGELFGTATPEGAQVDIRGSETPDGLALDLWMKADGRHGGRVWVYSVSMVFDAQTVGDIVDVDVVDLADRSVCSGVGAFDPEQVGTVCTFPNDGAVVVDGDTVRFELVREAARTALGGSFRFTRL